METLTDLLNINTNEGDVPSLDILTEMVGNRPVANRPGPSPLWWAPVDAFLADNDGLF